jgi:RHS repeat-associated protein
MRRGGTNPTGDRVSQTNGTTTTQYLVDPTGMGSVVAEFGSGGNLVNHFAYGLGLTSSLSASGSAQFYQFDGSANTVAVTGSGGSVLDTYSYLPFGEKVSTGSVPNPFTFAGQVGISDDGDGLYYMRARYYDPTIGRFISEDPMGFNGGDVNFYAYVGNNPLGYIDPSGYARKPGKTPNNRWPKPPSNACGNKPKWNPAGYWEGNGRRLTWDDRSHGTGVDRGTGQQGGHWDDETSNNRWDENAISCLVALI